MMIPMGKGYVAIIRAREIPAGARFWFFFLSLFFFFSQAACRRATHESDRSIRRARVPLREAFPVSAFGVANCLFQVHRVRIRRA